MHVRAICGGLPLILEVSFQAVIQGGKGEGIPLLPFLFRTLMIGAAAVTMVTALPLQVLRMAGPQPWGLLLCLNVRPLPLGLWTRGEVLANALGLAGSPILGAGRLDGGA